MPDWAGSASDIQYKKLTHICYAFVLPSNNQGGLLPVPNPNKLRDIVRQAHAVKCKVLISVFGGLQAAQLALVKKSASTANGRAAYVQNVVNIVNDFDLDGVDIDWEYPTGQRDDFTDLMRRMRNALPSPKLLTAAVIAGANFDAGLAISPEVFPLVDFLGIMTYDDNLPGQPHASYDFMVHYCNQWLQRGLSKDKLVAGIPFYARPSGKSYAWYVSQDRANADRDVVNGSGYNGRPTVRAKTKWAMSNAGGVMFWEQSQDTRDDTSLVSALYETSSKNNWWKGLFMGTEYNTFGDAIDGETVDTALPGHRESLRRSWEATNQRVYSAQLLDDIATRVVTNLRQDSEFLNAISTVVITALENKRWEYWNQAQGQHNTNNIFEAEQATNGWVFNPEFGLTGLASKLDDILKVLKPLPTNGE